MKIKGAMEFTSVNDASQINVIFTWVKTVKKKLLETFNEDDFDTLQFLQENIHEEFENLLSTKDKLRCEALYRILSDFYMHFCWRIDWSADSHMKYYCVQILYYMIYITLILSNGDLTSQWLNKILTIVKSFPGDLYLMFDAFLLIQNMNKKYREAYALLLKLILCQECIENPSNAECFAKVMLLFRRLKFLSNGKAKRSVISHSAYKVKCPPDFIKWKSSLNIQDFSDIKCDDSTKELLSKNLNSHIIKELFKIFFEAKYIEKLVNQNKIEITASNKFKTLKQNIFQMKETKLNKSSLGKRHLSTSDKIIKKVKYQEFYPSPQFCKTVDINIVETSNELKEQTSNKNEFCYSIQSPNNLHLLEEEENFHHSNNKSLQNEIISETEDKTLETIFSPEESSVLSQKVKSSIESYLSGPSVVNNTSSHFEINNKRESTDVHKSGSTYCSSYSDIQNSSMIENSAEKMYYNENIIISNYNNLQENSEILDIKYDSCNKETLDFSNDKSKSFENLPHSILKLSNRNFINVSSTNKLSQNPNSDTPFANNLTPGNALDVFCKNVNESDMQYKTISTIIDSNPSHFMLNGDERYVNFIDQQEQNKSCNIPLMDIGNFQTNKFSFLIDKLQKSSDISINNVAESPIAAPSIASYQPEKLTNSYSPVIISKMLPPQKIDTSKSISPVESLKQKSIKFIKSKKMASNFKSKFNNNLDNKSTCNSVQSNTDESIFTDKIVENTLPNYKISKKNECKKYLNTSSLQCIESQKKHKSKKKGNCDIDSDSLSVSSTDFKRKHKSSMMTNNECFFKSLPTLNADSKQKHVINKSKKSENLPNYMLPKLSIPLKKQELNGKEECENHSDSEFHSIDTSDCEFSDHIGTASESQTCNSPGRNSPSMFKKSFNSEITETLPIVVLNSSNNSSECQPIFKLQNNIFDRSITSNDKNLFDECASELENNSFDIQPLPKIHKMSNNESNFIFENVCFPEENISQTITVSEIEDRIENESVISNKIKTSFEKDSKETNKDYNKFIVLNKMVIFSRENSPKIVYNSQNQSNISDKFMSNSEVILEDNLSDILNCSTEIQPTKLTYSIEKQYLKKPTNNLSENVEKMNSEIMVSNLNEILPEELALRTKNHDELIILPNDLKCSFDLQPFSIQENAFNESTISGGEESSNNLFETGEKNFNESTISNLKVLSEKYSSEISNSSKNQVELSELVIFDKNDTLLKGSFLDSSSRNNNSTVSNHEFHKTFCNKQNCVSKNVFQLVDDSPFSMVSTSNNNAIILDKKKRNIHKFSKIKNLENMVYSNTNNPSNHLLLNSDKQHKTLSKSQSIFKLSKTKNHCDELQSLNSKFKELNVDFPLDKFQAESHIHDSVFDTATEFIPNTQISYTPESIFKELNTRPMPNTDDDNSKLNANQISNNDIVRELQDTLKLIKKFIDVNAQEFNYKSNIDVNQSQNTNTNNDLNKKLRKFHYLQHALKCFMNNQPLEESLELAENSYINLSNDENSYKIPNALNTMEEMNTVVTEMPTFSTSYDQNTDQTFVSVASSTPRNVDDTQLPSFEEVFSQKARNSNITSKQNFVLSTFNEQIQKNQKESEINTSDNISCCNKSKMPQIWECDKQNSVNEKSNVNQEIPLYKLQTPTNTNCALKHSANKNMKSTKPLCSLNYSSECNEITNKLCNTQETVKSLSQKSICQGSKKVDQPIHSYNLRRRRVYNKNCGGSCLNTS